jgi:sensitive to high expression protein 9
LKPIKQQFRSLKTNLSHHFADFPSKLSQLTGYGDIDKLKSLVSQTEANLRASREDAVQAKIKYNLAAQRRAESIKEVNDLLARKASWSVILALLFVENVVL